jgi:hypothetical protein
MGFARRIADYAKAVFVDSSSNVGIGTENPTEKLSVTGNIKLPNGANRRVDIGSLTNYTYSVMMNNDDFQIREDLNDSKVRFRIKYSGTSSLAGQLQLPIEGGSTLYNSYTCRAWVNFNGTGTVAIRGSGNVSSITDSGTGIYRVNFLTSMPDTNYMTTAIGSEGGGSGDKFYGYQATTSYAQFVVYAGTGALVDNGTCQMAVFR